MRKKKVLSMFLVCLMLASMILSGCGKNADADGKTVIELVQYKPEAVDVFEQLEEEFNAEIFPLLNAVKKADANTLLGSGGIDHPESLRINHF